MPVAKVAISLDPALLARVNAEAERAGKSRSEFVRDCLERALDAMEDEQTVREARAIYAAVEDDEDRRLTEAMSQLSAEALPPFRAAPGGAAAKRRAS